jgi:hypothetical protein
MRLFVSDCIFNLISNRKEREMRATTLTYILAGAAAAAVIAADLPKSPAASPAAQRTAAGKVLDSLFSPDASVSRSARKSVVEQRAQLVGALIASLEGTNTDEAKRQAVIVLGVYRAEEAAPVLVRHLDWDAHWRKPIGGATYDPEQSPVRNALYMIGVAALAPLLDMATNSADTNIAAECAHICRQIDLQTLNVRVDRLMQQMPRGETRELLLQALTQSVPSNENGPLAIAGFLARAVRIDDDALVAKCVGICRSLEGQDVAEFRLKRLLEKEVDGERKARIQSALQGLQNAKDRE